MSEVGAFWDSGFKATFKSGASRSSGRGLSETGSVAEAAAGQPDAQRAASADSGTPTQTL